jgi:hypothetical protein
LVTAVNELGTRWWEVARRIPGRTDDQCAKRWRENLNPIIVHTPWTAEEDRTLLDAYNAHGAKWNHIATFLPGRPTMHCRNRYKSLLRTTTTVLESEMSSPSDTSSPQSGDLWGLNSPVQTAQMLSSPTESNPEESYDRQDYHSSNNSFPTLTRQPSCLTSNPPVDSSVGATDDGLALHHGERLWHPHNFDPLILPAYYELGLQHPSGELDTASATTKIAPLLPMESIAPSASTRWENALWEPCLSGALCDTSSDASYLNARISLSGAPTMGPSGATRTSGMGAAAVSSASVGAKSLSYSASASNLGSQSEQFRLTCPKLHCDFQARTLIDIWRHLTISHIIGNEPGVA